ncbi:hypothetical protein M9H77_19125 [Catharanthus roseus]|uniref:Uncharacterized protein n=1 Tax=Catharanthus roseus TaxID=4058 RepID=A0ACC0B9E2_CATRO|nr:hypothetical protein M9H77_19125 [Catharanthus roseus]
MQDGQKKIECLLMLENADIPEDLNNLYIRRVCASSMVMKKLSGLQSTDCIDMVVLVNIPSTFRNVVDNLEEKNCRAWFLFPHRILVLDGIQNGVFLLNGCCDPFNVKASRASRGASFQLPLISDSLAETPLCLVLGSEGSGLFEKSRQECELVHSIIIGSYEFFAHEVENQPVLLVFANDLNHGKSKVEDEI